MNQKTKAIHLKVEELGRKMGFRTDVEVSESILALRLDPRVAYRPHIDLTWSLELTAPQRKALAWIFSDSIEIPPYIPVVGIEVEGTTPSTKTMASDIANLTATGVPLGLLIVSEAGERNIYRRAVRAVRSIRRSFGDRPIIAMDDAWVTKLLDSDDWLTPTTQAQVIRGSPGKGGESRPWTKEAREQLLSLGNSAGFNAIESYIPSVLDRTFKWMESRTAGSVEHTSNPTTGSRETISRAKDYFTACELDVAWFLQLPAALQGFAERVADYDPCQCDHGLVFPESWDQLPVGVFELETSSGKHAAGGLLNLSAFGVLGVAVTPDEEMAAQIRRTLRRYQPTLGLRNVYVRSLITTNAERAGALPTAYFS